MAAKKYHQLRVNISCENCTYARHIYFRWPDGNGLKTKDAFENARHTVEGSQEEMDVNHQKLNHQLQYNVVDRKTLMIEDGKEKKFDVGV